MHYNFDEEINRRGTDCVKWEFIVEGHGTDHEKMRHTAECFGPDRLLPMWVADMDFPSPQPVVNALIARAQRQTFGYTAPTDSYFEAVIGWMQRRQGWKVAPEWIVTSPGVVPALNMMVRAFTSPGDKVLIQPPVYHPFRESIVNQRTEPVTNPLIYEGGRYRMDFDDLERKVRDPQVKMAILCSPHNPVGRVWTRDELTRFGQICLDNGVLVVSDEIHGDLIYKGHTFTPFGTLDDALVQNALICTAPSKTFNLAGLQTSNIIVPNAALRAGFTKALDADGLSDVNTFGVVAAEAAYNHGDEWLDQVMDYIEGNFRYLQAFIEEHIPQITVIPPEGTYLVWLDCRRLGLDKHQLDRFMLHTARVYLDEGYIFGAEGEGFERINIACPRSILVEALERIEKAVAALA